MFISFAQRAIGSWLAVSMSVMVLSACTSGPMTMSEMICCAELHDECTMAGEAESCCAPDLQSDMGALVAERTDAVHAAAAASHVAVLQTHQTAVLSTFDTSAFVARFSPGNVRSHPDRLNTVLLI